VSDKRRDAPRSREAPRSEAVARAAIAVIAREGLRGLTHRAVDHEAGLPPGSTSYYARTRARLLELALERMAAEEDDALAALGADVRAGAALDADAAAQVLAGFVHTSITSAADRTRARFELALEAARRPELRRIYDRLGARYRALAESVLRAAGSQAPARHARSLIAWCDGIAFDALAGSGGATPPDYPELLTDAEELLGALLQPPDTPTGDSEAPRKY
jgi:DNA-binding transcriptional regulator YbjK